MNEQELREKLVKIVGNIKIADVIGHTIAEEKLADQILSLIKGAGWKQTVSEAEGKMLLEEWAKGNGWVKLADDQSQLPYYDSKWNTEKIQTYLLSQQDMLKAGWRKVEVK